MPAARRRQQWEEGWSGKGQGVWGLSPAAQLVATEKGERATGEGLGKEGSERNF